MRMKSINYVNTPIIFDAMFAMVKTFMKAKMLQRVCIRFIDRWSNDMILSSHFLTEIYDLGSSSRI